MTTPTATRTVEARNLQPGDILDLDPTADYIHEEAKVSAEFEYATVEATKGYQDALAGPGEIILYLADFGSNILLPANTPLTVVGHNADYDADAA